jgi:hypothetical protein
MPNAKKPYVLGVPHHRTSRSPPESCAQSIRCPKRLASHSSPQPGRSPYAGIIDVFRTGAVGLETGFGPCRMAWKVLGEPLCPSQFETFEIYGPVPGIT